MSAPALDATNVSEETVRAFLAFHLTEMLDLDEDDDYPPDDHNLNAWDLDSKKAEEVRSRLMKALGKDIDAQSMLQDYTIRGFIAAALK